MRSLACCTLVYLVILLGYVGGLIGFLFGPTWLGPCGPAAFMATMVMFLMIVIPARRSKIAFIQLPNDGLVSCFPRIWNVLSVFYLFAGGCLLVAVASLLVLPFAAGGEGVTEGLDRCSQFARNTVW